MALYIFQSLPLVLVCQLLNLTCFPLILNLLFLIVCGLQKHMAQLEGVMYKQSKQAVHVRSFRREFGFVSPTWPLGLFSLLIFWFQLTCSIGKL